MDLSPVSPVGQAPSLRRPVHRLDPNSHSPHHDAERMRAHGAVVPVELPGGVPTWAVTNDATARAVLTDTDTFSVERRHWRDLSEGRVPAHWPLMGLAAPQGRSLITTEGDDHARLRAPLAGTFTEKRVRALEPYVERVVDRLLDDLGEAAAASPDGVVDFRARMAWPLPMTVISHLLGVPDHAHGQLRDAFDVFFDDTRDPTPALAEIGAHLAALVEEKRHTPGEDLTSALLALPEGQRLTVEELIASIQVVIIAGHETTVHLLVHGVRALTSHPDQFELVRRGAVSWERAVEEVLRWEPPTANFMFRFATRDTDVAGVPIRAGDPLLISYIAMGRDPERHGLDADAFDVRRPARGHTSFGHGPHVCVGRPLARLEARVALRRLFERWPGLEVAATAERAPSVIMNAYQRLPVRLRPAAR